MGEIQKTESFQDRMKARIKESIGELLTDDELKKMIDRSMEEIFFTKRERPRAGSWAAQKYDEPLLHEIVKELVEPAVRQCVQTYIKEHPEEVTKLVNSALDEGLGTMIVRSFNRVFSNQMIDFVSGMEMRITELSKDV